MAPTPVQAPPHGELRKVLDRALKTIARSKAKPTLHALIGTMELHRRARICVSYASRLRNGHRTPSTRIAARIARALGVSMDEMLDILARTRERGGVE